MLDNIKLNNNIKRILNIKYISIHLIVSYNLFKTKLKQYFKSNK